MAHPRADLRKMAIRLGAFGRSFTLKNSENYLYNAPCKLGSNGLWSGDPAPYTREPGYMAYYKICEKLAAGWVEEWDNEAQVPYAHGSNQGLDLSCKNGVSRIC